MQRVIIVYRRKNSEADIEHILEVPKKARALFVFAHGAGAGMDHSGMASLAKALHAQGIGTLRFQFRYMERGSRRPDPPKIATATIAEAVQLAKKSKPKLPIFAGGKSFGGRMTTTAAAEGLIPDIKGIICFGFPLHPSKQPSTSRAAHLSDLRIPTLFVQGTRDHLADLSLLRPIVAKYKKVIRMHVIEGADHSFKVLKSAKRSPDNVLDEAALAAAEFCDSVMQC